MIAPYAGQSCSVDGGTVFAHYAVHFIVNDVSRLPKIDGVYDLIVAIILIAIKILSLAAVTGIVKEERIIRSGILDQPMHGSQDVLFGGLTHGVLLVIG